MVLRGFTHDGSSPPSGLIRIKVSHLTVERFVRQSIIRRSLFPPEKNAPQLYDWRGKKKKEEETEVDRIARCMVYTSHIGNLFQKVGFPSSEVFEVCGNISTWQCSRVPNCSTRTFQVDRAFRFVIDEATKEAMPVKYVQSKAEQKAIEEFVVVDSDEEELSEMRGHPKNPFEVKSAKEERLKRQLRRLEQPRSIRITPHAQPCAERFPDIFTGFSEWPTIPPQSHTFPDMVSDPNSLRRVPLPPAELPGQPSPPPLRCSHLLQHINVLDRHTNDGDLGVFAGVDPEKFTKERESFFSSMATAGNIFMNENHSVAMKRAKFVSYNISVCVLPDGKYVVDDNLRQKLFGLYGPNDVVPVVNENKVVGTIPAEKAAVLELYQKYIDPWGQGERGLYYFSHLGIRSTMQEPLHDSLVDMAYVQFPTDEATGTPLKELPSKGRISIVCETVIHNDSVPAPEKKGELTLPRDPNGNGCNCSIHCWQVAGEFRKLPFNESEYKGKDVVEYVLIGRNHHGVRIGVPRNKPDGVLYMLFQLPCAETVPPSINTTWHVAHCRFSKKLKPVEPSKEEKEGGKPPPVPTPNHQMCVGCHDVARPYVNMAKPGTKDDGFCASLLAARTKALKAWEKSMMDSMKQDSSKAIVILEVGGDKKMDPARAYSEKTFKTLKQSRCTFVRITNQDLEAKQKGGGEAAANYIAVQCSPIQGLSVMDAVVNEKMRKGR